MRIVKYRRARIKIPDAPLLTGICECCGEKRKTDTAHILYDFTTKDVRENPVLALENTLELCFLCHRVFDAQRLLQRTPPATMRKLSTLAYKKQQHKKKFKLEMSKEITT